MRYIVIGNSAVLATRDIERINEEQSTLTVSGVPDGATLSITARDRVHSYSVISERTNVDFKDIGEGVCSVTVKWSTLENNETIEHEAYGNPFLISTDDKGKYIIPAPLSSAGELERMWQGIADVLDVLLPLADDVLNGADVI